MSFSWCLKPPTSTFSLKPLCLFQFLLYWSLPSQFSVNTANIQHKSSDFEGKFERDMKREVARPLKGRKGERKFCHMREEKGKEKFLQLTLWFLQLGGEEAWIKHIHGEIWVKEWIEVGVSWLARKKRKREKSHFSSFCFVFMSRETFFSMLIGQCWILVFFL